MDNQKLKKIAAWCAVFLTISAIARIDEKESDDILETGEPESERVTTEEIESEDFKESGTGETEETEETENSEPFPQTEEYLINNTLIKYNEIADYPIDNGYIEHIIDVTRPLSRTTLTFEGGIYLIITNNDYGHIMFFDYYYYKNSVDNEILFSIIRDMTKSVAENFSDEDMDMMWEKKNGVRWEKTFDSGETIIFYDGSMGGTGERHRATCEFYLYGKPEWKK